MADIVDLTEDVPQEFIPPPEPKRLRRDNGGLNQRVETRLQSLPDGDQMEYRKALLEIRNFKKEVQTLRAENNSEIKALGESNVPHELKRIGELLSFALVNLDDASQKILQADTTVEMIPNILASVRRFMQGTRSQFNQIRSALSLRKLQTEATERDLNVLKNDPHYIAGRSQSLVTPVATTTRSRYQPTYNPPQSNSRAIERAHADLLNPGVLPDNSYIPPYVNNLYTPRVQESSAIDYEKLVDQAVTEAEPLDLPPEMNCVPLEHQKQGLGWLVRAERGVNKGSILADDMGLGKTVQSIALMYANPPKREERKRKLTLIICPVALMNNWKEELKKKVHPSYRYRVYVHHALSGKLINSPHVINSNYDVVICTFAAVMNQFKQYQLYKKGKDCKAFPLFEIKWHRVIIDEAHSIKNVKGQSSVAVYQLDSLYRLALTGTPMQNKVEELFPLVRFLHIEPFWNDFGLFKKMFINNRHVEPQGAQLSNEVFQKNKELIALIAAIMLRRRKDTKINGKKIIDNLPPKFVLPVKMAMVNEERIDYNSYEASVQKSAKATFSSNREGNSFAVILVLLTRLRQYACHPKLNEITASANKGHLWKNNEETRTQLGTALNLDPELCDGNLELTDDDRFCNGCNTTVQLPEAYMANVCGHIFCDECANLKEAGEEDEHIFCEICSAEIKAYINLEAVFVVRTNQGITSIPLLVDKLLGLQRPRIEKDRNEREWRAAQLRRLIVEADSKMASSINLFDDSDDDLEVLSAGYRSSQPEVVSLDDEEPMPEPKNEPKNEITEPHDEDSEDNQNFGSVRELIESEENDLSNENGADLRKKLKASRENDDPLKYIIDIDEVARYFAVPGVFDDGWVSSTKVDSCLDIIRHIMKESPSDKIIIFSVFTSFLDLLTIPLLAARVPYELYTGKLNINERNAALREFQDGNAKILLTSLRAGNVGLTLTAANRVIIMEPFWNPYIEDQAQDRVYRIGQSKEVDVFKLLINESVEDRIVALQEEKRGLIEGVLDPENRRRTQGLSRADLMYALGFGSRRTPENEQNERQNMSSN